VSGTTINTCLLLGLCVLVAAQIVAKVVIFRRVFDMLEQVGHMLRITEAHGAITDAQRERVDQTMSVVVPTVRRAVDEVPEKVANKVVEKLNDQAAGDSGKYRHPDAK
jgi:hypothetical protein